MTELLKSLPQHIEVVYEEQPRVETLVELFRWRGYQHPKRLALSFLLEGSETEVTHSYGELDLRARSIAARLQAHGMQDKPVLMLFPAGLDFVAGFLGCLYGGAVAIPAYPPHPARLARDLPRIRAIARDALPVAVLTVSSLLEKREELCRQAPELGTLPWLAADKISVNGAEDWLEREIDPDSLAFLQYTSGSTASPRGVMVTHGNLLHNSSLIHDYFETGEDCRGVFWLPAYHDMGLVGGILQVLFCGTSALLMSPLAFLQRPMRWLQAISRTGANISGGPNFAYDLCARKATPEQIASLDLSCWELAFNGAEPVRADTLERFAKVFEPCGFRWEAFYPCYGLAEGTLIVSGGKRSEPPVIRRFDEEALKCDHAIEVAPDHPSARTLVGCGEPHPDQEVVIVDPDTSESLPEGRIGEIWVAGPSVAAGYWRKPEESAKTFQASLREAGSGRHLRTGDLGFLKDGELFVTGRLKDLIVLEGRNHYPQDIERTVERAHPTLRDDCSAVFLAEIEGRERLVVVAEVEPRFTKPRIGDNGNGQVSKGWDEAEVVRIIRRVVSEMHDLQVHSVVLIKPGRIPKTSSGKIQRHACRAAFLEGKLERI